MSTQDRAAGAKREMVEPSHDGGSRCRVRRAHPFDHAALTAGVSSGATPSAPQPGTTAHH